MMLVALSGAFEHDAHHGFTGRHARFHVQSKHAIAVATTALTRHAAWTEALIPVRAVGESVIGRQFSFTVEAVSTSRLALKTLIAQPVTLWIQQIDHSYRPFHGYVNTARLLGSDGTLTTYQLSFASWLHFLKFRKDARIWQEKSADQIIADVFDQHPQGRGAYKFVLSSGLPKRSFCMEYEDDWNFVHRLMEHEGLFGFFTQADDGKSHMLTITDNLFTFSQNAGKSVDFYRAGISSEADSLTHWSCTRALQSTQLTTRTFDYKSPFSAPGKGTHTPTLPSQGTIPLEASSKILLSTPEDIPTDERAAKFQECFVNVSTTIEANA
ncbi:phage late control D family protein [Robbsia andropogonis]|uniref:phage late control D family protein n=1 Tax=Robbsia andropogonis TaxID=28092 RepID=UPI003D193BBB